MKRQVAAKQRKRRFGYIRDIVSELRKVVWPTRRDATNLTVLVVVISLAVGVILGGLDLVFSRVVSVLLLGGL